MKDNLQNYSYIIITVLNKNLMINKFDFYLKMNAKLLLKYYFLNFNHTLVNFNKM